MPTPKRPTQADKDMLVNILCDLAQVRQRLITYCVINLSEQSQATMLVEIEQKLVSIVDAFCKEASINYEQFLKEQCPTEIYPFLKPGNFHVETLDNDQKTKAAWKEWQRKTGGLS